MLDGKVDELPTLEALKTVVLAALPPRPAPQQVSTLEDWQAHAEALLEKRLVTVRSGPSQTGQALRG